jgi:Condensation domain
MAIVRSGPLTWSQMWWVSGQPQSGESSHEDNLHTAIPAGRVSLEAARAAIADVVRHHENLRSRLDRSEVDRPLQIVDAADDAGLSDVIEVVPASAGAEVLQNAMRIDFRVHEQWPIKVLVLADAGKASALLLVMDHWAVDAWSLSVLRRDLSEALAARAGGSPWSPSGRVEQPVDVAEWEASPSGGGVQLDEALRFWRDQLELMHKELNGFRSALALPGLADAAPMFGSCRLSSHRTLRSAEAVASRLNVPVSAVFLAAYAAAICAAEQAPAAGVFVLSANRLSGRSRRSVRNAALQAPVVLLGDDRAGFNENVASAARQQVRAYRFANADPVVTEKMWIGAMGDLWRSGVASAQFNYLSHDTLGPFLGEPVDARPARQPTTATDDMIHFGELKRRGPVYMLKVHQASDRVVMTLCWREDTGWGRVAESMLRYIEDLVCQGPEVAVFGRHGRTAELLPNAAAEGQR